MTHDHGAYYAQCGKNYKILLLVMLTRIFTRKSNAPLDKFPNFHCKEKNSSQMPGNAWGWGVGMGNFGINRYITHSFSGFPGS